MNKIKILLCWVIGSAIFCIFFGYVFIDYAPGIAPRFPSCTTHRVIGYFVCAFLMMLAYLNLFSDKYIFRFIGFLIWLGAALAIFSGLHSVLLNHCWYINYLDPLNSGLRPTEYIWVGVGAYLLWAFWGWWLPEFDDDEDDEDLN